MSRFLEFITPGGEPAFVRPDLVSGFTGTTSRVEGRMHASTWINFEQGRGVLVRGEAGMVRDAVDAFLDEHEPKLIPATPMYFGEAPNLQLWDAQGIWPDLDRHKHGEVTNG